jgi:hypothetical protein
MRGAFNLIVLIVILAALVVLGQLFNLYDIPQLHDLPIALPGGSSTPQAAVQPVASVAPSLVPRSPVPSAAPVAGDVCSAAALRFVQGAAALKAGVGASMGEPLECERIVDADGDTEQRTTTGLAYYRARTNIAAFTNGFDHWALTPSGIVHWTGEELEPPTQ